MRWEHEAVQNFRQLEAWVSTIWCLDQKEIPHRQWETISVDGMHLKFQEIEFDTSLLYCKVKCIGRTLDKILPCNSSKHIKTRT